MDTFLRLAVGIGRLLSVFVLFTCLALAFIGLFARAEATECGAMIEGRDVWSASCAAVAAQGCLDAGAECGTGSCTFDTWTGTGWNHAIQTSYPSCWYTPNGNQANAFHRAFFGPCPTAGDTGPNIDWDGTANTFPPEVCHAGCYLEQAPQGPTPCTTVVGGGTGTGTSCLISTQFTGDRCTPGATNPAPDESDNEQNPEVCDDQNPDLCVSPDDGDGDPHTPPTSSTNPQICMGATCRPIAPNPAAGSGCSGNPALCTGGPNGSAPPPHPSAPYPPNQAPAMSGTATAGPNGSSSTPWTAYATPAGSESPPGPVNGQCEGGASLQGDQCVCPPTTSWSGSACDPDGPPDEETDERSASNGTCGGSGGAPACGGDEIDCAVLYNAWVTRCALEDSGEAPQFDIASDPLDEFGGADAFFDDNDDTSPADIDEGGFLGGGGCPTIPPIMVLGTSVAIPPAWCDLAWFGSVLVAIAYVIAIRIVYGE